MAPFPVGYGLLVPDEPHNLMRGLEVEFQARYGDNPGLRQPPHITFKAPFATEDLEPHRKYLDALAATTPPVDVEFTQISFFDGGVMFLDVAPNAALGALTSRVLRDLGPAAAPSQFEANGNVHYHGTLAFMDPAKLEQAKKDFSRPVRLHFSADQIGLFLGISNYDWIVVRVAKLSG